MTTQLPPVTVWHTDTGIAITITPPGTEPDDTATTAVLPPESAADLIDAITLAMQRLGAHQRTIREIDAIILTPDDET